MTTACCSHLSCDYPALDAHQTRSVFPACDLVLGDGSHARWACQKRMGNRIRQCLRKERASVEGNQNPGSHLSSPLHLDLFEQRLLVSCRVYPKVIKPYPSYRQQPASLSQHGPCSEVQRCPPGCQVCGPATHSLMIYLAVQCIP